MNVDYKHLLLNTNKFSELYLENQQELSEKTGNIEAKEIRRSLNRCMQKNEPIDHQTATFEQENLRGDLTATRAKKPTPSLRVVRLDYDYPPVQGDIDCPDSFQFPV